MSELPVEPAGKLRSILASMPTAAREALLARLLDETPARWIAEVLTRHGHPVGETTVKTYKRKLRECARE